MRVLTIFLFIISTVFINKTTLSQITITQWDIATVGNFIYQAEDTLPPVSLSIGTAGANQIWNFDSLTADIIDTSLFTNPNWTPYANEFSSISNLAIYFPEDSSYSFLNQTAASIQVVGVAGFLDTSSVLIFNPGNTVSVFPTTYLTSFSDTLSYDKTFYFHDTIDYSPLIVIDSTRFKHLSYNDVLIDAYGTVTTPLGTYSCLREKIIETAYDTNWAYVQGYGWQIVEEGAETEHTYKWWTNGIGFSLLDITLDSSETNIKTVRYLNSLPDPSGIVNDFVSNLFITKIYPNPAKNIVTLSISKDQSFLNDFVIISDVLGRTSIKLKITNKEFEINTSIFSKGLYIFQIVDESNITLSKGKFIIN